MLPYFSQPRIPLGPVTIHAFGVLVAMAVLVGTEVLRRRAAKEGLDVGMAQRLIGWVLVAGFIGAHLVDRLVYFPAETLQDPLSILWIWQSLSSFGGFLGGTFGAWLFLRKNPLGAKTWRYLDTIAYAFPFGWIFGRTGCFVAFDHPGRETTFFLGQVYKDNVVRYNLGLLEAIYFIPVIVLFLVLGRRRRGPGFYVALLALVYVPFRFSADFLRIVDVRYGGLTPGQWGTIALAFIGVWGLRRALRLGPSAP
jgi:phosphatidylglycerol:prolipoprotein diacylglycerol transferase